MFDTDERGQAIQVGAILLFSFVIIGLSLYQATVVPNQNAQVEFDHNQEVQQDMTELRTAVIGASYPGRDGVTSVTLGTNYPARAVAINPGPPSGTLRTRLNAKIHIDSDGSTFSDENVCGTSPDNDITRTLVYEPNYNEFNGPQTIYENSVVYNKDTRNDGEAVLTRQALYYDTGSNDGTINLIALQNEYQQSSSQSASLEFIHGETKRTASVKNPKITLPTLVDDPMTWAEILSDIPGTAKLRPANDEVTITFSGTFDILCTPVGVGGAPSTGATNLAPPKEDSLPSDAVAYDDADRSGEYDPGEDTYTERDLYDFNEKVNLVILGDDSGEISRSSGGFSIKAEEITSEADIEGSSITLKPEKGGGGTVDVSGNRIETTGGSLTVTGKEIGASGASISTDGGGISLKAEKGGDRTVDISGTQVETTGGSLTVTGKEIDAGDSLITTDGGGISLKAEKGGGGPVTLDGADISTKNNGLTVTSKEVSGLNSVIEVQKGSVSIKATKGGGGPIDMSGARIKSTGGNSIKLTGGGDIFLDDTGQQQAKIEADSGSTEANVDDDSNNLHVDGLEIIDNDDKLDLSPDEADVYGRTESGGVN